MTKKKKRVEILYTLLGVYGTDWGGLWIKITFEDFKRFGVTVSPQCMTFTREELPEQLMGYSLSVSEDGRPVGYRDESGIVFTCEPRVTDAKRVARRASRMGYVLKSEKYPGEYIQNLNIGGKETIRTKDRERAYILTPSEFPVRLGKSAWFDHKNSDDPTKWIYVDGGTSVYTTEKALDLQSS